ncbi:type VI secretion system ATPase TssH [Agrobacterium vitis]|uniref:Type VI secretion system ATPase TssH n=1 Tax=Agrobacterium vitis TaxID=373 RepID=A0A368NXZ4_AGRVI|nr:type VI secretion system ATPase TssH [Agrobacterium vitis]KAA3511345.1 type VI secretion system ATPase TssH [Agrobacterium vitis]KAA3527834.1 type VI secretion system ATPase TssH [Agrobacterium vitis]MCF1478364.1 type VI secretion system ATPase TssH [Agrobacterium vitis]MUZ96525.1 type VI secretion system ATPase TssH [Agrobacterium vitis]MVA28622.1 type VI secretion system ATPase TssH [Agrobacterium vitis]
MSHIDLNRLIESLEPDLRVALETAASTAAGRGHGQVDIAHLLAAVMDAASFQPVLEQLGLPIAALRREVGDALDDTVVSGSGQLALSQNILTLGREAWICASLQSGRRAITLADIFAAMDDEPSLRALTRGRFPSLRMLDRTALETLLQADVVAETPKSSLSPASAREDEFLRLYTHDLTEDARAGRLDPVVGRDGELRQMIDILLRRRQNNPILVGEAGVGKTAVAEALALEIAAGRVPEKLQSVRLLMLDLTLLQAGAGVKGEFERRLTGVIEAVKRSPEPIILFIDEAHGLIGAGGASGQGDAANILKPALARGEVRTIAATTWSEYKKYFEKDAALTRRFQPVHVREPDEETAIRMLRGIAETFMAHHGVKIRDEAIVAAVQLSARFLPARQLPDKAVSLIDTAAATVSLARQTVPEQLLLLKSELSHLTVETDWLAREPDDTDVLERRQAVTAEMERLTRQIDSLQARYDAEIAAFAVSDEAAAVGGDKMASKGAPDVNVTPLISPQRTRGLARRAASLAPTSAGEEKLIPHEVDRNVVAAVLARWTGIPLGKLLADQIESAKSLDMRLKEKVIGQDAALERIGDAMRAARAGLSDPRRPPAVFMLVGMSGTGKTETALTLADLMYGGSQHLTTINMSEFKEEHKVSMLLGAPPGYVGYGEGGVLTEAVRRRPYGVLLLDEIDKAHPGVQDIFYQVFDKGMLRDGEGRDVDFRNTTIFMTANTGSELLASLALDPDTMPEGEALEALLMPELQKQFKPAFLGRTVLLPFMPLGKDALSRIVDIQIDRIRERIFSAYGTELFLSEEARNALIGRAVASEIGARAIEIMIGRDLLPPLSSFFLELVASGGKVTEAQVTHDERGFGVRAGAAGENEEFVDASGLSMDKDAASEGVSRRMRQ